ncbi:hypothetical protein GBAR_LOCUS1697 [Geodia barretti]|uniref:Uncharacterized protein n=1 Tax=Geodia barretti TaxID=519541 RepID=A0AA35QXQ4_GEOBA|nr:hypothetical protein GBAR_LOCUS1697 [Geodia barretti]
MFNSPALCGLPIMSTVSSPAVLILYKLLHIISEFERWDDHAHSCFHFRSDHLAMNHLYI